MAYLGFLFSKTGILKIIEVILGLIIIILCAHFGINSNYFAYAVTGPSFLLCIAVLGMVVSFIELVSFYYDDDTYLAVRRSIFEVLFCFITAGLYIAASITLAYYIAVELSELVFTYDGTHPDYLNQPTYWGMIIACILGIIASIVYLIDGLLALRELKRGAAPPYSHTIVYTADR